MPFLGDLLISALTPREFSNQYFGSREQKTRLDFEREQEEKRRAAQENLAILESTLRATDTNDRIAAEKAAQFGLIKDTAGFEDAELGKSLHTWRQSNSNAFNDWLNITGLSSKTPDVPYSVHSSIANMPPEELGRLAKLVKSSLTAGSGFIGTPFSAAAKQAVAADNLKRQQSEIESAAINENPDIAANSALSKLFFSGAGKIDDGIMGLYSKDSGAVNYFGMAPEKSTRYEEMTLPDGQKVPVPVERITSSPVSGSMPTPYTAGALRSKVDRRKEVADRLGRAFSYRNEYDFSVPKPVKDVDTGKKAPPDDGSANDTRSIFSKMGTKMEGFRDTLYNAPSRFLGVEPSSILGQAITLGSKPVSAYGQGLDILGRMAYDYAGPRQLSNVASKIGQTAGELSNQITRPTATDQAVEGKIINLPGIGPAQRVGTTQEGVILKTKDGNITVSFKKYQELLEKAREVPQNTRQ